jgi:phosphoribosylglycinamide formyltransferase-1
MVGKMKEDMRREMLQKRDEHHSRKGHQLCILIMDRFLRLGEFNSAKCILLYASKGSEVHTEGIIRSALSLGKRVALPVTNKERHELELYEVHSVDELAPGAFEIMEPEANAARKVEPDEVDLAVVPGVSFDQRGHRIGYGKGYYDKLLPKISGKKVGLAYEIQIVGRVPEDPHDVAVDMVVTEEREIGCSAPADAGEKAVRGSKAAEAGADSGKARAFRIAVLASGRGSDFQSLIDAKNNGELDAAIVCLITDNPEAKALQRAKESGIPSFVVPHSSREELDRGILKKLDELAPDLVVLAGYMKIIRGKALLSEYSGRIINIHPSLLPKYPGAHAQKDAFDAGEKVSGYTIHFVDESLDGGRIIYQEKVDISGCKSADEAAARILEREHVGLPAVVQKFAKGEMKGPKR